MIYAELVPGDSQASAPQVTPNQLCIYFKNIDIFYTLENHKHSIVKRELKVKSFLILYEIYINIYVFVQITATYGKEKIY